MGAARLVEHGRTGLVIDPAAPDQLADAIKLLAQDEGARRAYGAAAQRASADFAYRVVGARRADLLTHALGGRARIGAS